MSNQFEWRSMIIGKLHVISSRTRNALSSRHANENRWLQFNAILSPISFYFPWGRWNQYNFSAHWKWPLCLSVTTETQRSSRDAFSSVFTRVDNCIRRNSIGFWNSSLSNFACRNGERDLNSVSLTHANMK